MEAAAENPKLLLAAPALVADVPEREVMLPLPKIPPCLFLSFKDSTEKFPAIAAVEAIEGTNGNDNSGDAWVLGPDPLPALKVEPD